MNNQDQFHALLKERVEATRRDHETAIHLLREYERMFNVTGAQTRTQAEARPAPQPMTETAAKKTSTAPANGAKASARAAANARASQPAKTKKKTAAKAKAATKKAAPVKAKTTAKASSKTKAKTPSRPGPKPNSKRENVPSLIKAIQIVMGRKTMNADQVFEALNARGWLPSSNDPIGYIRYTLSKNKDIFLRVDGKRGHYHLDQSASAATQEAPKAEKKNGTAKETKAETAASDATEAEVVNEVDDLLSKSGVDLSGANPFADQPAS